VDFSVIFVNYLIPIIITGVLMEILKTQFLNIILEKITIPIVKNLILNVLTIIVSIIVVLPTIFIVYGNIWQYMQYVFICWLFSGKGYEIFKKFNEGSK
jgi:hypothetical protein